VLDPPQKLEKMKKWGANMVIKMLNNSPLESKKVNKKQFLLKNPKSF
jgi:hypothetical protein